MMQKATFTSLKERHLETERRVCHGKVGKLAAAVCQEFFETVIK